MEKYGFVYIWYDVKHKRYYIGAHWGTEDDGYVCSSTWMTRAYQIRPDDFRRRILERINTNKKDTFLAEHKWLQMIKLEELRKRYYNLRRDSACYWIGDESKKLTANEKISASLKSHYVDNPQTMEANMKRSETLKGRVFSDEHREKLSVAASKRILPEEVKQKISDTKSKAPAKRIYFDKKRNKYLVQYQHKTIGRFPTEEAAEVALKNYLETL